MKKCKDCGKEIPEEEVKYVLVKGEGAMWEHINCKGMRGKK
jgi:hypothetical protein